MKIEDIGRKLGDMALTVANHGCNCAGECGSCGSQASPHSIEPENEREGDEDEQGRGAAF